MVRILKMHCYVRSFCSSLLAKRLLGRSAPFLGETRHLNRVPYVVNLQQWREWPMALLAGLALLTAGSPSEEKN